MSAQKGTWYRNLIARYLVHNFSERGIAVYTEVPFAKRVIGKDRKIDVLVLRPDDQQAFGIECKFQSSQGTADEKIPYALQDLEALPFPCYLTYAGEGWFDGILHVLAASPLAAYCMPDEATLGRTTSTRVLDHLLAARFGWWDLVLGNKQPVQLEAATPNQLPLTA